MEIFEASPMLGGLAGPMTLDDGTKVDRFYHAILSSDSHLRQLCDELGIADQLRFNETKMGFYYKDEIYSMNNMIEFLRFPAIGMDRSIPPGAHCIICSIHSELASSREH